MAIAQSWVEYTPDNENTGFDILNDDISKLDFGNLSVESDITKYIGLKFKGCSAGTINIWIDGLYGDIYPYDTANPILYEEDLSQHNISVYAGFVTTPQEVPDSLFPDQTTPLIMTDVFSNYKEDGYSTQVLAIKLVIGAEDAVNNNCEYRGIKLMLCYDTKDNLQ